MSSNSAAIEAYRKELSSMLGEISNVDKKVLNKAVNVGLARAKMESPVVTGFLRKSWATNPLVVTDNGVEKELVNTADYSLYWNYGHRIVSGNGKTTGWCEGSYLLENSIIPAVEKAELKEFNNEIRRIQERGK